MKYLCLVPVIIVITSQSLLSQVDTAWVRFYDSPQHSMDLANTVLVDSLGNVYVSGLSSVPSQTLNTIAYDSTGKTLWTQIYGCIGPYWLGSCAMAMNQAGDLYVAGAEYCHGPQNFGIVRYSAQGDSFWTRLYPYSPTGYAMARTLTVDSSGNVYIVGTRVDPENPSLWATVKYNRNGDRVWVRIYAGDQYCTPGEPFDIALDDSGNIIVIGEMKYPYFYHGIGTVKYDSSGNQLWANISGDCTFYLECGKLAIDHNGNIYLPGDPIILTKYSSDGNIAWSRSFELGGGTKGVSVTVDSSGYIYVAGIVLVLPGYIYSDYLTIKYTQTGEVVWARTYDGPALMDDIPFDIAVGRSGAVYVAGTSQANSTSRDYCVVKYSSDGDLIWVARYNRTGTGYEKALNLALDKWENIYLTGACQGQSGERFDYDFTTVKFRQNQDHQIEDPSPLPEKYLLFDAYPNPFNSQTNIRYELSSPANVTLSIFNLLGMKLETIFNKHQLAGWYQVQWNAAGLPSGTYFCQLKTNQYAETKRILLIK